MREARSPEVLIDVAAANAELSNHMVKERSLLQHAIAQDVLRLAAGLTSEQADERAKDEAYWAPLKAELEQMRSDRRA